LEPKKLFDPLKFLTELKQSILKDKPESACHRKKVAEGVQRVADELKLIADLIFAKLAIIFMTEFTFRMGKAKHYMSIRPIRESPESVRKKS